MKLKYCILFILTLFHAGCKVLEPAADHPNNQTESKQIMFHQSMATQSSGSVIIEELDKISKAGQTKDLKLQPESFDHPVEIIFLDKSGKRINSSFIENPLIQEYEYADDDGSLKRITSYEDSAIFTLRYNLMDRLSGIYFLSVRNDTLPIQIKIDLKE